MSIWNFWELLVHQWFQNLLGEIKPLIRIIWNLYYLILDTKALKVKKYCVTKSDPLTLFEIVLFARTEALEGQIYHPPRFSCLSRFFTHLKIFLKEHLNVYKIAKQQPSIFKPNIFMSIWNVWEKMVYHQFLKSA